MEFHHALLQTARWPNERLFESKSQRQQQKRVEGIRDPKIAKEHWELLHGQKGHRISNPSFLNFPLVNDDEDCDSSSDEDDEIKVSREQGDLQHLLGQPICSNIKFFKLHGSLVQADRYVRFYNLSSL